eukprot:Rmarinus@m.1944
MLLVLVGNCHPALLRATGLSANLMLRFLPTSPGLMNACSVVRWSTVRARATTTVLTTASTSPTVAPNFTKESSVLDVRVATGVHLTRTSARCARTTAASPLSASSISSECCSSGSRSSAHSPCHSLSSTALLRLHRSLQCVPRSTWSGRTS